MNKKIKNISVDMELVLSMYNAHPYFSLKNLGKRCTLYMAKCSNLPQYFYHSVHSTE